MAESFAPPLHEDPGIEGRRRSHAPVRAETWVLYRKQIRLTLPALHSWHQMARPCVERKSPQESQLVQHIVHLASGAGAPGWPRHKDRRRTHAESSLLQRTPRKKAQLWCSKKALQRSAEETACRGGNQRLIMAAGGLRPRQLALISEKSQL